MLPIMSRKISNKKTTTVTTLKTSLSACLKKNTITYILTTLPFYQTRIGNSEMWCATVFSMPVGEGSIKAPHDGDTCV